MPDSLIGKTLGQYQIVELAGRGGMATVYKAYQPSLRRYVALKVLPDYLAADEEFVVRFRQEALAAAALRHPNILVIHDVGQEGNTHYMAMEFLEGQTLSDVLRRTGGLPLARIARLLDQIASALDFAHRRGLVHRDIKPANIFIGQDDHVTLVDFGIVKAMSGASVTRTGMMVGTPEYMSPEQIDGRPVDQRSDLYSLGVVLYQMLTGQAPFTADTPSAVMYAQVNKQPTPPSKLTAFVTPEAEAVVLRALAKNPQERFNHVREMAQAFSQAVAGQRPAPGGPTVVMPVPPLPKTMAALYKPAPSPRPLWPIFAGLGALALIAVMVIVVMAIGVLRGRGRLRPAFQATTAMPTLQVAALPTSTLAPTATLPLPSTATPTPPPTSTRTPGTFQGQASSPTSAPTATLAQLTATPTQAATLTPSPARLAPTTRPGTLFDLEAPVNWRRGDQPNGALTQSAAQAHSGLASARLDYSFPTSANDFVVFINQVPLSGQPNAIGAWAYGDGSGHFLNVWIKDASGQVWQVPLGRVGGPGWNQMAGYIAPGQPWPWTHISGPDNGTVDYPVSFYALVLDDYPDTFIGSGTIYVDDISVWKTDSIPTPVSHAPAVSATPGAAVTSGPTPTVANEPRGVILINPLNGAFFKSSDITFRWSGGALQPGETFLVEIIPALAEKKGTCMTESDYGNSGHQFSPPLTDHQWTTDIAAPAGNKSKPCAGRIEWRVHVRDANGNTIQSTPRSYFEWNPL